MPRQTYTAIAKETRREAELSQYEFLCRFLARACNGLCERLSDYSVQTYSLVNPNNPGETHTFLEMKKRIEASLTALIDALPALKEDDEETKPAFQAALNLTRNSIHALLSLELAIPAGTLAMMKGALKKHKEDYEEFAYATAELLAQWFPIETRDLLLLSDPIFHTKEEAHLKLFFTISGHSFTWPYIFQAVFAENNNLRNPLTNLVLTRCEINIFKDKLRANHGSGLPWARIAFDLLL